MTTIPIADLFLSLGALAICVWLAWGLYRRVHRWYKRTKPRVDEFGYREAVSRRAILKVGGVCLAGGLGVRYYPEIRSVKKSLPDVPNGSDIGGAVEAAANETGMNRNPDPMVQQLDGGFNRIVWNEDGSATIYFRDDHSMDGFAVLHEYVDNIQNSVMACEAPTFAGPIKIPLQDLMREADQNYPTRTFKLQGYSGSFTSCEYNTSNGLVTDTLGTTWFTVPEQFVISDEAIIEPS